MSDKEKKSDDEGGMAKYAVSPEELTKEATVGAEAPVEKKEEKKRD